MKRYIQLWQRFFDLYEAIGWIGNIFCILALWRLGLKDRTGFLYYSLGEGIYIYVCYKKKSSSMTFICTVFTIMALWDWYSWD